MSMKIEMVEKGPLSSKVKGLGPATKAAMKDALLEWHHEILPGHFVPQEQFAGKYASQLPNGYVKRGAKYLKRKARMYGHRRNLEFSGELRRNVTSQVVVSGTGKRVRGRLPGSQKANFKRSAAAPDMRDELVVTTPQEQQRLAEIVDAKMGKFFNDNAETRTINL